MPALLVLVACEAAPRIDTRWQREFDPCSARLHVFVSAAPGSTVSIGSHRVLVEEGTGVPAIELQPGEVGAAPTLTVAVEKDRRTRTFAISVPAPPAGIEHAPLTGSLAPVFRADRLEGGDLVLSVPACNVRQAGAAAGQVGVSSATLTWHLPLLAIWDQQFGTRRESTFTLPRLTVTGADGVSVALAPVAPVHSVLAAIGSSFPGQPLAAAPPYRRGGPLVVVGSELDVVHAPASGVALRDVVAVAISRDVPVDVERCTYVNDAGAHSQRARRRIDASVVVYESRTGRVLGETTLRGATPPECAGSLYGGPVGGLRPGDVARAATASLDFGGFSGRSPDVARWLARF